MENIESKYIDINKKLWNDKTDIHVNSEFYNVEGFLKGETSLKETELYMLGDIKGKSILHLQCHFGMDSISLSRMGARVTGVDFSDQAISKAKELASQTQSDTKFICSDIYSLPTVLNQTFDIIYTTYGTIGWLPDLNQWAQVISTFLKPNGKLIMVDFHPVVWMFDNDFTKIEYRYFKSDAIIETEIGTYADKGADIKSQSVSWNHSISEILNNLIANGLTIDSFDEIDYSPYNCFSHTTEIKPGKFIISHLERKIPMLYAIKATKK